MLIFFFSFVRFIILGDIYTKDPFRTVAWYIINNLK